MFPSEITGFFCTVMVMILGTLALAFPITILGANMNSEYENLAAMQKRSARIFERHALVEAKITELVIQHELAEKNRLVTKDKIICETDADGDIGQGRIPVGINRADEEHLGTLKLNEIEMTSMQAKKNTKSGTHNFSDTSKHDVVSKSLIPLVDTIIDETRNMTRERELRNYLENLCTKS